LALRKEIEEDISRIEGENGEIDLLMEQVLNEIERHDGRRSKMEARLTALEASAAPDPQELAETRDGLLALTRREMLFDAQRQVLEGKQRVLARFLQRLTEIDNSLAAMGGGAARPVPVASSGLRPLAAAAGGSGAPGINESAMVMRGEEKLRKEIVRQLHDGPAQSIANIGMQAEIVERLVQKEDPRAREEVESLRRMVQAALATTKDFIFEIRPMVLDDLGLGPTVRRFTNDRGQRAGINVEFDSRRVRSIAASWKPSSATSRSSHRRCSCVWTGASGSSWPRSRVRGHASTRRGRPRPATLLRLGRWRHRRRCWR
jgi:two-component system sensor histidine kinase DegS